VFKTAKFKKLQQQWYRKIAKAGHVEIENTDHGDKAMLYRWDSHYFASRKGLKSEAQARYYELARQFLNDHNFDTSNEKLVWEQHSEGLSIVDIASKLRFKLAFVRKCMKKLKGAFGL